MTDTMSHQQVRDLCEKNGIPAGQSGNQLVPKIKPDYMFRKDHVREMVGFVVTGLVGMKLTGPQGCGKTTLVEQFHAALDWPLLQPATHARTEAPDLNGQVLPTENGFQFIYGHLINAARHGCSVFIDEYNVLDPSVTTSLNPILEGGKVDIPETGETIVPAPGFRVFAAHNPNDRGLGFHGRKDQDAANAERFWTVELDYPDEAHEKAVVHNILVKVFDEETARSFAQKMVELAAKVRQQYMGTNASADALDVTMSTRVLKKWALGLTVFAKTDNPIHFTLARAFTNSASPEAREAIHQFASDIFGAAN